MNSGDLCALEHISTLIIFSRVDDIRYLGLTQTSQETCHT